jgi:flagella basal body P-ring formation protein FlgA
MRAPLALVLCCALCRALPAAAPAAAPVAAAGDAGDALALPAEERLQNEALAFAEAQAAALSGTYTFKVLKAPVLPKVADPGKLKFERAHLSSRDLGGHFFASFNASVAGRPIGMVRVDLEGKWNGKLLRSVNALARKTVPEAGQFEAVDFEGAPPAGALGSIPDGTRLRAPISAGHVLVMQDLETIPVIMAGDPVRVAGRTGALTIGVDALARSSGAVGEKVRVELTGGHKNLQAVVTGPGEARIQWAGN